MTAFDPGYRGECLTVAIIYDCLLSGRRAIETYESLFENLDEEFQFELHLCRVEELSHNVLVPIAKGVANADLVIVSLDKDKPLPSQVREALETLPGGTKKNRAVALLLSGNGPGVHALDIQAETAALAEAAGVDFFMSDPDTKLPLPAATSGEETSYIFVERASEGWGIND